MFRALYDKKFFHSKRDKVLVIAGFKFETSLSITSLRLENMLILEVVQRPLHFIIEVEVGGKF